MTHFNEATPSPQPVGNSEAEAVEQVIREWGEGPCDSLEDLISMVRGALTAQGELAEIRAELLAGQGDDDGLQILPDFEEGETVLQMVCKCIALLETRRDVVEAIGAPVASPQPADAVREALETARDYISDAATGTLTYKDSGEGFKAMAAEDLARLDAALSASHLAKEGGEAGAVERPAGWAYEFHEFGDVWARHIILNRPDGEANPPTKHHGGAIRNVRPVYFYALPQPSPALAKGGDAVREAFRAGWKINAVGTDVHPQEYLDGCEEVDWEHYASEAALNSPEAAEPTQPDRDAFETAYAAASAPSARLTAEVVAALRNGDDYDCSLSLTGAWHGWKLAHASHAEGVKTDPEPARLREDLERIITDTESKDAADLEDMANVGHAIMSALKRLGRSYSNSPEEVLFDLENELFDAKRERDDAVKALETAREDLAHSEILRKAAVSACERLRMAASPEGPIWGRWFKYEEAPAGSYSCLCKKGDGAMSIAWMPAQGRPRLSDTFIMPFDLPARSASSQGGE